MRHKNDIALAATSARSYNRHWRAKKMEAYMKKYKRDYTVACR